MHILDDLTDLSTRAKGLLERTGRREQPQNSPGIAQHLQAGNHGGHLIPSPMTFLIRREGFDLRYGGLRYQVRRSYSLGGERRESVRDWHYDLGGYQWTDPAGGGYFDWFGERVSSPLRYLVHTDGRVGAEDGTSVFLEIAPSIPALIESHALTDMVSAWECHPADADILRLARTLDGLDDIPEASGPTVQWRLSDDVAVQEFQNCSSTEPRHWRAFIWFRGEAGRIQIEAATKSAGTDDPSPSAAA